MQPNPQMMHPQSMMGQGFDPAYGSQMGQMGGYGGFPTGPTPYPGMMQSFPPVGGVGLSGVAPHVNPSFFGRGMPANGMGMMPATGMDRQGMNMWSDPSAAGWAGEDPAGRAAESSYEDAASDHQYGDGGPDRGGRRNALKDKDRVSERDWSGSSDRKYRDERDPERIGTYQEMKMVTIMNMERYREDRDRHVDHRYKDRGPEYDDMGHNKYKDREPEYDEDWDRGRSSRAYSKSRVSYEEDYRARGRDVSKRRRLPSE
ncbi:hypothetical protein IFM89_008877 [Coptis chinensis]|uniref:Uncharacterized protein n=1 Tax=Coptis chinensis TaxID=261450 RepID=A0A835HTQ7_9MAGN|nr:hypothetical protein IFM89_008877 [Coptis chinensis]